MTFIEYCFLLFVIGGLFCGFLGIGAAIFDPKEPKE